MSINPQPSQTLQETQVPITITDSTVAVLSNPGGIDFGTGLTVTDDGDGTVTVDATADVVGPASAVDENITVFDGTTGKLIKDGGESINDIKNLAIAMAVAL